jgi:hypothetical protein
VWGNPDDAHGTKLAQVLQAAKHVAARRGVAADLVYFW